MNAINMIDGIDGLAGGVCLIALLWMGIVTGLHNTPETVVILILSGCIGSYLIFNMRHPLRRRACVFMGDSGSMMLGAALVWLLIRLSQHPASPSAYLPPVVGLWLVAVPLLDTLSLMAKRKMSGKSPFAADRSHLHHILKDSGLNDCETTFFILTIAACLGGIAVISWKLGASEQLLFIGFMMLAFSYYYFVHHSERLAIIIKNWNQRSQGLSSPDLE